MNIAGPSGDSIVVFVNTTAKTVQYALSKSRVKQEDQFPARESLSDYGNAEKDSHISIDVVCANLIKVGKCR